MVKQRIRAFHACYTRALARAPTLAGTVTSAFFIAPDGTVAEALAVGVDPAVATCVAQVVRGLVFPAPQTGGGVQVNYPITFRP